MGGATSWVEPILELSTVFTDTVVSYQDLNCFFPGARLFHYVRR